MPSSFYATAYIQNWVHTLTISSIVLDKNVILLEKVYATFYQFYCSLNCTCFVNWNLRISYQMRCSFQ